MFNDEPVEEQPMRPDEFIGAILAADNLAELGDFDWPKIATEVLDCYRRDKDSMKEWFDKMKRGIDLANMVKTEKNYPFKSASNIKYPLITTAALQFNARAYPAIVAPEGAVKAKIHGKDPSGQKQARGDRVAEFMSYQLVSEIEEWEGETDKLLVQLPIVGQMFRKVWYDPVLGRPCCKMVEAGRLIVSDKARSLEQAPRLTEEIPLYPDEIETRINSGQFIDFDYTDEDGDKDAVQQFVEQHIRLDLDEDGYEEPYIVTVHVDTQTVVRAVPDFDADDVTYDYETVQVEAMMPTGMVDAMGQPMLMLGTVEKQVASAIVAIRRNTYYVDYKFLPSLTEGFHGTGLGLLLGDISDTVNTIFNQLMDAGHYASLGGGFIGGEFRIKGGSQNMRPGEWRNVSALGGDIRSAMVPMTFPGPDATLYEMMGMLLQAGREIASVQDVMTGEAGRANQPATTTLALIEQGMMVFSAVFKRIFRALKTEFRLLAKINAATLDPQKYSAFHDETAGQGEMMPLNPSQDFGAADMDVEPVADPRSVTKMQEAAKAQMLLQMPPGSVNPAVAAQRAMEAMGIANVEELAPPENPMQGQMMEMQMQSARADLAQKMADVELTIAKVEAERAKAMKDLADPQLRQREMQIEATLGMLNHERERISAILGATTGGLAGTPGNGGASSPLGSGNRGPQGGGIVSLLGGQANPGGQPLGPAPFAGMG